MSRRVLLLILMIVGPVWAAEPPARVQMDFAVTSGTLTLGKGRDVLEHDGKRYSIVSESKTVGIAAFFYKANIRRESRGLVTRDGLRPLHFEEDRTRKPKRAADFDWGAKLINLTDGPNVQTLALPDNTFDQTSFVYAFAFQPLRADRLAVQLTDGRKLSDYQYEIVGKEIIKKTPLGDLETIHIRKVSAAGDKRGFEVWLAVAHHHLPVRIRFVEKDGTVLDSNVTALAYP